MSLEDNIRALERTGPLAGIGREALRLLAFSVESVELAAGERLFSAGEDAPCAYAVVSGRLRLEDGVSEHVAGPGHLIGELALVNDTTRPCDAVADSHVRLLAIPRPLFLRMLKEFPDIAGMMRARLLVRLREEAEGLARIRHALDELP